MDSTVSASLKAIWVTKRDFIDRYARRWTLCVLTGLLAWLAGGCASSRMDAYFMETKSQANVFVRPERDEITKIAVLPFKAPTELIGASVSDMFVTEMLRAKKYTLVERSQMAGVLSETELALAGLSESKAVEVGRMLGADAVLIGTVDEYAMQASGGKTYAVAGISTRLIHTMTGQIIWSADLAKKAEKPNTPLSQHGRIVVHEITSGLYHHWVRQKSASPVKRAGVSDSAVSQVVKGIALPSVPQALSASDMGLREVTIAWKPEATSDGKVRVERAESAEGPFVPLDTVPVSRGRYRDRNDMKDAQVYYYRAVGVGADGQQSRPSNVVESMTAPPPDAPSSVVAEAPSPRLVTVSWTPPRSESVVRYQIERALSVPDAMWVTLGETAKTAWEDVGKASGGLSDSTTYRYRVLAINRVGASGSPSEGVEVTTLPPPPPVEDCFATPRQVRCVPLSWAPSTDVFVTGYMIERQDAPGAPFLPLVTIKTRTQSTYLDGRRDPGDLEDDRAYVYRIRAFNSVGAEGEWSEPMSAITRAVPPPPENITTVSELPRAVEVAWTASEDEKVVGYRVERREENGVWVRAGELKGIGTTRLMDRDGASVAAPTGRLSDGTSYSYRVAALNTAGALSDWTAAVTAKTKSAPMPPVDLTASTALPKQVVLNWAANTEPDINAYVVESRAETGSRWREIGRTPTTTLTEGGLDDGESRAYRVKAVDACTHESAWSMVVTGTSRPLPFPPLGIQAEVTKDVATVSWEQMETAVAYRLYSKGLFSSQRLASVTDPVAILALDKIGRKASLYVTVVDEMGLESRPSDRVEVYAP